MSLLDATDKAIAAAPHLQNDRFAGSIEALRMMAAKADAWQTIVEYAQQDLEGQDGRKRPAVPANDNVTLSSYARLAEQLGLTPIGRKALEGVGAANGGTPSAAGDDEPDEPKGGTRGGKLGLITPLAGAGARRPS